MAIGKLLKHQIPKRQSEALNDALESFRKSFEEALDDANDAK